MSSHVTLSSARQDWRTPFWFLDLVRMVGPIILDPAGTIDNETGAKYRYARMDNACGPAGYLGSCGLAGYWGRDGLAFINPPYGAHLSGPVEPTYEHHKKGILTGTGRGWAARIAQDEEEWIALVPVRTETVWWRLMHSACDYAVLWSSPEHGSRIKFVDPDTGKEKAGSNLASTVFYHGSNVAGFLRAFAPHGRVIPGEKKLLDLLTR